MAEDDDERFRITEAYLALLDADEALDRYIVRAYKVSNAGGDPVGESGLHRLKIELHAHVIDAFRKQRPYIKSKLDEDYWKTDDIDVLRTEDDNKPGGLHLLDKWALPIRVRTESLQERHRGETTRRTADVQLQDFRTYKTIIDTLYETAEKLGILPDTKTPTPGDGVITEDDIQFAPDEVKDRILPEERREEDESGNEFEFEEGEVAGDD